MSVDRRHQRQAAKAIYKKAIKGIPKHQRVPFCKIYKTLIAKENRVGKEDNAKTASNIESGIDLLTDLVVADTPITENVKNEPNNPVSVESDLIL